MESSAALVSPKQVARAIGVSESSLKRWCDQGLIKTVRTAGGHRKIPIADVMRFAREHGHQLVSPELLGLPPASPHAELGLTRSISLLAGALLAGDELLARQVVYDLYLAKHSLSIIFDEVIAAAFREIGDLWACHDTDVYQERRGCEITRQILFDLRKVQQCLTARGALLAARLKGISTPCRQPWPSWCCESQVSMPYRLARRFLFRRSSRRCKK